jgi:hypothetical protein
LNDDQLARLAALTVARPKHRSFYLFGVDVTSQPRPYAVTLEDRSFVYQPMLIKGNKPVRPVAPRLAQAGLSAQPDGSQPTATQGIEWYFLGPKSSCSFSFQHQVTHDN